MAKVTIKAPELQQYQQLVYEGVRNNREDSIHTILSPRQMGKSWLIEMLLLDASINHADQTSIVVEPTLAQSRKMANEIYNIIKKTPIYQGYNSQLLEIKFTNGSQIIFKSSDQGERSVRGYTVTQYGYLIFDEAAYDTDEIFYASIPLCNAEKAAILLFSTPRFKTGFFYDYYTTTQNNCYRYNWAEYENPFLTNEKREMIKATMPVQIYLADYEGKWMESTSDIFGNYESVLSNNYELDGKYTAGIDWGSGKSSTDPNSDYTAISIMNEKRQQVYINYWNDLDETQTINKLADIIQEWKPRKLVVETNSIGAVYLGLLKKEITRRHIPTQIIEVQLNNDKKNEIYQDLIVGIQNKSLQLLDNQELKMEMAVLKMERTKTGKITYNASKPYHDDCLDATGYSLYAMKTGNYAVR